MVNEDIVTVLRNAVNNGESLQHAMQVLTSSGYNPQQVQEASRYVRGGTMPTLEPRPSEQLIMAQDKRFLGKRQIPQTDPQMQQAQNQQQQRLQSQQSLQNTMSQQPLQQPLQQPFSPQQISPTNKKDPYGKDPMGVNELKELTQPMQPKSPTTNIKTTAGQIQKKEIQPSKQNIKLKKKSHKKEIILLIILLFLIGILASTVFFRESILTFLSG
jgi:FtsZ-interacting cell division protein ZipA